MCLYRPISYWQYGTLTNYREDASRFTYHANSDLVFYISTTLPYFYKLNYYPAPNFAFCIKKTKMKLKEKYFLFNSQLFSFWIFSGQYSFVYFQLLDFPVLILAYFRPQVYSFDSASIYLVLKCVNNMGPPRFCKSNNPKPRVCCLPFTYSVTLSL